MIRRQITNSYSITTATVSRDEWEGMIDEIMAEQHALYEQNELMKIKDDKGQT